MSVQKNPTHRQLPIVFAVALLCAGAVSPAVPVLAQDQESGEPFTEPGQTGAALPEMVVEAENEVRQEIEKSGFEFKLDAAMIDSFYSPMDEIALQVSPVSGLQPHLNNLEILASDQPPHFWIRQMASTPVVTFYPEDPEGHKVKSWDLAITDFRGSPFRTYSGKGKPPKQLSWDGRDEDQGILEVGYPYSYVFSVTDKGTNSYNYAGVSFRIPALDYRDGGDRVLELAGDELFLRQAADLTDAGKLWLTRCADEIRRHPYSPVRVVVVAETQSLADTRADVVATFLARSMTLPREQVETEGIRRPDLRVEMDGSVAVRIEHAEGSGRDRKPRDGSINSGIDWGDD